MQAGLFIEDKEENNIANQYHASVGGIPAGKEN